MFKLTHCCLALALAVIPTTVLSQDAEKAPKRGIRFICTDVAEGTPDELKLLGKKGIHEVVLSTRMPGDLFEIPAEGIVMLGEETGDPEKPIRALAKGKIPAGTSRATALLIPKEDKKDGTKYDMFVIADDMLPGGSAYFLNLTKDTCMARLDGKQMKLEPGKPIIFQPSDLTESRNSSVAIMVETRNEDKTSWRPLMSSTWRLRPNRIEICIVYWNEKISLPSIKGLTLFPIGSEDLSE